MDRNSAFGAVVSGKPKPLNADDIQTRYIYGRDGRPLRIATIEPPEGAASRGICVLLHGQTEFIEKYLEVIGELGARGFTVATMDWRGQGGSARLLDNHLKVHIDDFATYDSDLQIFLDKVVRNLSDKPPVALAHSMGAHILLRTLHSHPDAFAAAVLTAPMQAVQTRGYSPKTARRVCRLENMFGQQAQWVFGMKERDPLKMTFADQLVTSDPLRFARTQAFLRSHPDLRLAGPTWGWLEAAYRSMEAMEAPGYIEAITTPLLVFGAGRDRIVETAAVQALAARLPNVRYEELQDAEHEILMENNSIRARFWAAFDAFIQSYA